MMDSQTINQNKFLLHKFSGEGARERKKEERERERAEKGQERKRRELAGSLLPEEGQSGCQMNFPSLPPVRRQKQTSQGRKPKTLLEP